MFGFPRTFEHSTPEGGTVTGTISGAGLVWSLQDPAVGANQNANLLRSTQGYFEILR